MRDRLRGDGLRLLVLTGPGGVGKTRLALHAAAGLHDAFPDGIVFVPLAPLGDPALVLPTIGHTLGVREVNGQPLVDALREHLRDKALLLVLDNFEHVLAAAVAVNEVLATCPRVRALVTTRSVLHVTGEHEYPVPPLRVPDSTTPPLPLGELRAVDAVRLFVTRAQAAQPDFALTAENAAAVAETCRRLDGLPLAIELAAARVRLLPPAALVARLEHRLPLLTGGPHDVPVRQQTLRNTMAWSYDLLATADQVLFRRLGVFVGGFTLDAAQAVCAAGADEAEEDALDRLSSGSLGVSRHDPTNGGRSAGGSVQPVGRAALAVDRGVGIEEVMDGVARLQDQSLLDREASTGSDPGQLRFAMLETIREFALEQLAATGESATFRWRHARYYLSLAEHAEPALEGADQTTWLDRLDQEHANLRAALEWLTEQGARALGLRLAAALYRFWVLREHGAEGCAWLTRVLALPAEPGEPGAPPVAPTVAIAIRAKALAVAGNLAFQNGDLLAARGFLEESLALGVASVERLTTASPLLTLGLLARALGEYPRARALAEERLRLARASDDAARAASSLWLLGTVLLCQGDVGAARPVLAEAMADAQRAGDELAVGQVLLLQGELASHEGNDALARERFDQSLALLRTLGAKSAIAAAGLRVGLAACAAGDLRGAHTILEESLSLFQQAGAQQQAARALSALGRVARAEGQSATARSLFQQSLAIAAPLGRQPTVIVALEDLGGLIAAQGDPALAARVLAAADALRAATGDARVPADQAAYARDLGRVRAALGEAPFAAAWSAGHTLTMEQAAALALATATRPYPPPATALGPPAAFPAVPPELTS